MQDNKLKALCSLVSFVTSVVLHDTGSIAYGNVERALTISPVQVGAFNDLQADIRPKHPTITVDEVHSRGILPVADDNR